MAAMSFKSDHGEKEMIHKWRETCSCKESINSWLQHCICSMC